MAESLSRPLSDGADEPYWTMNLNTTSPSSCPPEGLLKMDLRFNEIRLVVSQDQHGNPIHSEPYGLHCTTLPTLNLPGTMNRAEYYTALQQWLRSLCGNQIPLEGDVVNHFTNQMIERVFREVNFLEKVAICVQAELYHVSFEYEDDEEYVREMSDCFRVVAAEEHRRFGDCSICLEGLVPAGEEKMKMNYLFGSPCGHFFHSECMEKWLRMSDSCPLCRFEFSSLFEEE